VTESFTAKKIVDLLLKLRKSDHAELNAKLVVLDGEITKAEADIVTAEAEMNAIVYRLYGLLEEDVRMIEAG
jgi:hypothetical protein